MPYKTLQIVVDDALYNGLTDLKGKLSWRDFLAEVLRQSKEESE
jgi:predicted CopG family antitoxin